MAKLGKADLVDRMASEADISKAAAERALNAMTGAVEGALKAGGSVSLVGFGTFSTSDRKARMGRNPQTGAAVYIAARRVPKFKAGKGLKDAVAASGVEATW